MTCPAAHLTWAFASVAVRWRIALGIVVVTQLVTHPSARNAARSDASGMSKFAAVDLIIGRGEPSAPGVNPES
jgi:hypothetical protein